MLPAIGVADIFPPSGSVIPAPRFPPPGPSGRFPGLTGTTKALRLPAALARSTVVFPRQRCRSCTLSFAPPTAWCCRQWPGLLVYRSPFAPVCLPRRRSGPPRFLGRPPCAFAMLFDPGRAPRARAVQRAGCWRRQNEGRRPQPIPLVSRLNRTATDLSVSRSLSTLHPPGHPGRRKTRFRLAVPLCRAGLVTC